jgi:hypothetical protein
MIEPLEFDADLSLEEAERRFGEIADVFGSIKADYSDKRGDMRDEDLKTLCECGAVLIPLAYQRKVQSTTGLQDGLLYRVVLLTQDIGLYLSEFDNSGVTRLKGSGPILD